MASFLEFLTISMKWEKLGEVYRIQNENLNSELENVKTIFKNRLGSLKLTEYYYNLIVE